MKVKIEKSQDISPTTKLYSCKVLEKTSFLPGQYLSFFISNKSGKSIRAYSFCSQPEELPKFQLCVKQVPNGVGTTHLLENIGSTVKTSEPAGDFVLPKKALSELVFIAGGTGIAPVRSQIFFWLTHFPAAKTKLIYRYRGENEYLFRDEFDRLSEKHEAFSVVVSDSIVSKNWQKDLADNLKVNKNQHFYIVGPGEFVNSTSEFLKKEKADEDKMRLDIWE